MKRCLRPLLPALIVLCGASNAKDPQEHDNRNAEQLGAAFALKNAPKFAVSPGQQKTIDRVIAEMKGGYGGTIVTAKGPDDAIDTPAFLSRYLREFAAPEGKNAMQTYDYRFERILARSSSYSTMLDDPRLDWDIWRAFLVFEGFWDGQSYYRDGTSSDGSPVMSSLDSAKDLLWMYLERHGPALLKDPARLDWWMQQLTRSLDEPGGRPVRCWFLLALCSIGEPPDFDFTTLIRPKGALRLRKPSPHDPFLVVKKDAEPPAFAEAIAAMARDVGLTYEVWGVDPATMPATRVLNLSLEMAKYPVDESHIIGQESWSAPESSPYEWTVRFFHSVGQRAAYSTASLPSGDRKDGVFLFVRKGRLYAWPKAEMDAGVLQLLHVAGLLDDAAWAELQKGGFHELKTTLSGP